MTPAQAAKHTLLNDWYLCPLCGGDRWQLHGMLVTVLGKPAGPSLEWECHDCAGRPVFVIHSMLAAFQDACCQRISSGVFRIVRH